MNTQNQHVWNITKPTLFIPIPHAEAPKLPEAPATKACSKIPPALMKAFPGQNHVQKPDQDTVHPLV